MENINKSEKEVLITHKITAEGKDFEQAEFEVKRDIAFIRNYNNVLKEKKEELNKIEKERIRINEDFKKNFEKLKKQQDKLAKGIIKTSSCNASTLHLQRIVRYLEEIDDAVNMTKICADCLMTNSYVKNALQFLTKFRLVKEEYKSGMRVYSRK